MRFRQGNGRQDTRYDLTVSLPLGSHGSTQRTSTRVGRSDGGGQAQLSLTGAVGERRALNYSLSGEQRAGGVRSSTAFADYQGRYAHLSAGFTRAGHFSSHTLGPPAASPCTVVGSPWGSQWERDLRWCRRPARTAPASEPALISVLIAVVMRCCRTSALTAGTALILTRPVCRWKWNSYRPPGASRRQRAASYVFRSKCDASAPCSSMRRTRLGSRCRLPRACRRRTARRAEPLGRGRDSSARCPG